MNRETAQSIPDVQWNSTSFQWLTKVNGTSNNAADSWGTFINNAGGGLVLLGADDAEDPVSFPTRL